MGPEPQNVYWPEICGSTRFIVSMTQLIFGAALGFILGQAVLAGAKQLIGSLFRNEAHARIRSVSGSALLAGFIRYSGLMAVVAALVTLGAWGIGDYLASSSARRLAEAHAPEHTPEAPLPDPHGAAGEIAALPPDSNSALPVASAEDRLDPYHDPEFKVHQRPHHAGKQPSLKEILLQRSEARARDELLAETKGHMRRSQYDCEAADRASRYLSAGLDVWAFASWQLKHFPVNGYKGATLDGCKDIETVVEPSGAGAWNGA
jgi:hypothetical protein